MSETNLKGFTEIGQFTINGQLRAGLMEFFKWGLLNIGGFYNVHYGDSSPYGGDRSRLRPVKHPYYATGRLWEGFRNDWVWESGLAYHTQPIQVSGIKVGGVFYEQGNATYPFTVNYPLGQILFTNPVPTGTNISVQFSHRAVTVTHADTSWFKQVLYDSHRVDSPDYLQFSSGVWYTLSQNRVQLPAVVLEIPATRRFVGKQLGGGQILHQDVIFHILSETESERSALVDIISEQNEKTIFLFDNNRLLQENRFPLTAGGSIASGALSYPNLVQYSGDGGYRWKRCRMYGARGEEMGPLNPTIFGGIVRITCEVHMDEI